MSDIEVKPSVANPIVEDLAKFETNVLKHVEVAEKVNLPSKEDIENEKKHISLVNGVEQFDKNKLKPTVTQEKIVLPDRDDIENEKKSQIEKQI
ncbi:unnamed protein product [Brachionus calyciflorus]|uniref:Thymosin n=1 Tax=Brachionus calyciflorus TaxID=104777 RepID=A0A813RD29_9BILA|nr:unnamed protein product [Brachionus calyciflorus]